MGWEFEPPRRLQMSIEAAQAVRDCRKTYETLKARGVEVTEEPTEHFYGTGIGVRDLFGNYIRIVQLAPQPQQVAAGATSTGKGAARK